MSGEWWMVDGAWAYPVRLSSPLRTTLPLRRTDRIVVACMCAHDEISCGGPAWGALALAPVQPSPLLKEYSRLDVGPERRRGSAAICKSKTTLAPGGGRVTPGADVKVDTGSALGVWLCFPVSPATMLHTF